MPSSPPHRPSSPHSKIISLLSHPGEAAEAAALALAEGEVVLLPTDTVYGLAAMPGIESAVGKLFQLKRRPDSVSVAVLTGEPATVYEVCEDVPQPIASLISRHWPGALTIVMQRRDGLDWALGRDSKTRGLRCPNHKWLRSLLRRTGPLAVTSANLHGQPSASEFSEVLAAVSDYESAEVEDGKRGAVRIALAVDGGRCEGQASTVVAWENGALKILRSGPLKISLDA